jgi:adenylate kinase
MKGRLVLLGPPATGKGTQAALISSTFGIPSASTGAMLREAARQGRPEGIEAARYTKYGGMFPDELALRVVRAWIEGRSRFLLDGFPRTLAQACAFDEGLAARATPLDAVFLLDLPEETIRERMTGRLSCQGCGAVYNRAFHNLSEAAACPACGGSLHRRDDDTEEALALRMREYREKTLPVCAHYSNSGLLTTIDATPGRDAVFRTLYDNIRS